MSRSYKKYNICIEKRKISRKFLNSIIRKNKNVCNGKMYMKIYKRHDFYKRREYYNSFSEFLQYYITKNYIENYTFENMYKLWLQEYRIK